MLVCVAMNRAQRRSPPGAAAVAIAALTVATCTIVTAPPPAAYRQGPPPPAPAYAASGSDQSGQAVASPASGLPPASYTTASPGPSCDGTGGKWTAVNSSIGCDSGGSTITKTLGSSNWGEQRFELPGRAFPESYTVSVTVTSIQDPAGSGGCAGIAVHGRADPRGVTRGTADTLEICDHGTRRVANMIHFKNGAEVSRQSWDERKADAYTLAISATIARVTGSINSGNPHSAAAVSGDTDFVALDVFWQTAGTSAKFTNFRMSAD